MGTIFAAISALFYVCMFLMILVAFLQMLLGEEDTELEDTPITAVSILVRNPEGLFLGVSRKDDPNAFGLPGGKIDPGETPEQAAVRELEEETGLDAVGNLAPVYEGDCPGGTDGISYYVLTFETDVAGEIHTAESGRVAWVTKEQLLTGPFGLYNARMLEAAGY